MNILVIHNNNIPLELVDSFCFNGSSYYTHVMEYQPNSDVDVDTFFCKNLDAIFQERQYNAIVLPYSFGEENYVGYSGLRLAAHVRLTKEWNHFAVPILFLGGDDILDVMHFSDLGGMLASFRIFTSTARTKEELSRKIDSINCDSIYLTYNEWLEDSRFQMFLNRIHVEPPANYATHHSVANKWAVLRWIEMFSWNGDTPKIIDEGFKNMLYFKYLMAQSGVREVFTNKNKKNDPIKPIIYQIYPTLNKTIKKRRRVVYIDDEEALWSKVLAPIFKNSDVDFVSYHFDKRNQIIKSELIKEIKTFLQQDYLENGGADCYLIDLRLHDDDFADNIESEDLSGQQIAKYIKKKSLNEKKELEGLNEGCQIVVFTASNKSWNVEESVEKIGACGYVIKESPEMNYTREKSYRLFCEFSQKIRTAFKLSYLQQLYKILDEFENKLAVKCVDVMPLYDYADLLRFDNGRDRDIIIKSCITSQTRFLEYIVNKHDVSININGDVIIDKKRIGNCFHRVLFHYVKENGFDVVDDVDFFQKAQSYPPTDWNYAKEKSDVSRIVVALLIYYKISLIHVKKTVRMRYERNTSSAHGNKETTITVTDLQEHFEKVIVPILKKESEN